MNAPQFESLLKVVCDAFVDAKKDGKIDAGDMIRVGLLAAGKVGVLKNLTVAEKKAVVLELLEKGLKSLGPKPLGLDEAVSVEVEKQLMTAAGAAIDMALMSLKARSLFSYQLCCAGPVDVDAGAFVAPASAVAAVAAVGKVLDLSGSSVAVVAVAVAAVAAVAVAKVVDVSGVVVVVDLSGAAQSVSNPSTDSQKEKTDTPAPTQPPLESSPVVANPPQPTEEIPPPA